MQQLVKSLSYILSISLIVFLLPINTNAATPTYNYEWVSQSGTISADGLAHEYTNLEPGQTINLSLTLYNRSGNTIQSRHRLGNSPDKQVPIGSWGIGSQTPHQDGTPHFLDTSSYVLNNNRFAYYEGADVSNNSLITMNWNIKLANNLADGVYNLYVRPVSEYLAWTRQIKNGKLLPTTSSDIYWRFVVGEGDVFKQPDFGFQVNVPDNHRYNLNYRMNTDNQVYGVNFSNNEGEGQPYSDYLKVIILSCHDNAIHPYCSNSYKESYFGSLAFQKTVVIDGKTAEYYDHSKSAGSEKEYMIRKGELIYVVGGLGSVEYVEDFANSFKFIRFIDDFTTYSPPATDFVFDYPSFWEVKREVSFPFPDTTGVIALVSLGIKGQTYPGGEPITVNLYRNSGRSIDNAIDWWTDYLGSGWTIFSKSKLNTTYEYKNDYKTVIYQNGNSSLYENFVINEHGFVVQVSFSYTTPGNAEQELGWQAMERIVHSIR